MNRASNFPVNFFSPLGSVCLRVHRSDPQGFTLLWFSDGGQARLSQHLILAVQSSLPLGSRSVPFGLGQ